MKTPCECETVGIKRKSGLWNCHVCGRKFLPVTGQQLIDISEKEKSSVIMLKKEPVLDAKHVSARTDCLGVSIDVLLAGQESECQKCEQELSEIRAFQTAAEPAGFPGMDKAAILANIMARLETLESKA